MSADLANVLLSGFFAPKPKPRQWLSVNGVRFHLEKPASQAAGRNWFESLCGFMGDCNEERFDGGTFLQCADCLEVASKATGTAPVIDSLSVGNEGGESPAMISPPKTLCANCGLEIAQILDYADSPYWNDKTKPYGWHHVEATDNSDGEYQTTCTGEFDGCEAEPSLPSFTASAETGVQSTATDCTPWYFSCVRRGIDGFIAAVDWVVDRETAEYQGVCE